MKSTVDQALVITEEVDDLLETSESEIDVSRDSIQTIKREDADVSYALSGLGSCIRPRPD